MKINCNDAQCLEHSKHGDGGSKNNHVFHVLGAYFVLRTLRTSNSFSQLKPPK